MIQGVKHCVHDDGCENFGKKGGMFEFLSDVSEGTVSAEDLLHLAGSVVVDADVVADVVLVVVIGINRGNS